MMKREIKGFVVGMIITILVVSFSFPSIASELNESIEVTMNKINIALNGESIAKQGEFNVLDNGTEVPYSILYEGTTYLPLRKVAEIIGYEVTWDGTTSTANLIESKDETSEIVEDNNTISSGETVSQKNAIRKAQSYLDYSAFSRKGLIEQLEYEGFSNADSIFGTDNSGANWNEQAAKKAQSYLEYSAFSRTGLIAQLEYEGFTYEQAVYGVDATGL